MAVGLAPYRLIRITLIDRSNAVSAYSAPSASIHHPNNPIATATASIAGAGAAGANISSSQSFINSKSQSSTAAVGTAITTTAFNSKTNHITASKTNNSMSHEKSGTHHFHFHFHLTTSTRPPTSPLLHLTALYPVPSLTR